MMKNLKVAATAAAAAAAMATSGAAAAHATSVTVTNGGTFDATAGAMRYVITGGLGPLNCTNSRAYTTVSAGTYTGTTLTPAAIGALVPAFSNCVGPLNLAFIWNCGDPSDHANATTMLNVTGTPSSGATPISLTGISCTITMTLTGCQAVIMGSVEGKYRNPSGSTNGTLTVETAGQSLNVVSSGCTSIIPLGSVQLGAPVGGGTGLGSLTFELTTAGPTIT